MALIIVQEMENSYMLFTLLQNICTYYETILLDPGTRVMNIFSHIRQAD